MTIKKVTKKISSELLSYMADSEILKLRFKNISLTISGSDFESCIEKLYSELKAKNLTFKPNSIHPESDRILSGVQSDSCG